MPLDPLTALAVAQYAALVIAPGLAILALVDRRRDPAAPAPWTRDAGVRWGLAAGIGLALQPLVYLWGATLGLPVDRRVWWLILFLAGGLVAAPAVRRRFPSPDHPSPSDRHAHLALAAILLFTLASRWWAARDLSVPSWGDSVHHTMITSLFMWHRGLPADWTPFAPLSTFSYHFGLHASVASLVATTTLPAHRALIIVGQALMVLQVLTAYALIAGLSGRRWAGVGAALAAAGLSTMPAYYINWGRYTQLAGQVILPAAALAAMHAAGATRTRRADALVAATLVAGLALTHYLVTLLFGLLVLAWLVVGPWDPGAAGWRDRGRAIPRLAAIAVGAFALALPWLPRFLAGPLGGAAVALSTTRVSNPDEYGVVSPWTVWSAEAIGRNVGWPLVVAAGVALVWLVLRRDRTALIGLVWTGLLLVAAYPQLVGLPVTGIVKDFTVAIMLYLPLGLIVGGALGDVAIRADAVRAALSPRAVPIVVLPTIVVLVVAALAWRQRDIVTPDTMLVMPADEAALAWIEAETPPGAVFLVSSFPAFGATVLAGDDAGWWIPLLAAPRRTTLPPINYGIERSFEPGYRERVNRLTDLWRKDLDAPDTRAALAEAGVTYAFVGVKGRQLDRARLESSPNWEKIYDVDGAVVFRDRGRQDE